uniref:Sleeping Beauty transposase HTH domain-containing protein n=1 Tax=Maylandia zebra TaxID=106582 RepID=A0A3P9DEN1_9CICH
MYVCKEMPYYVICESKYGTGYKRISKLLKVPASIVGAIIRKWKEHNFSINQPRPSAHRKISHRGVKKISRYNCVKENNGLYAHS